MKTKSLGSIAKVIAGQSPASSTYNSAGDGLPFFQGKADFQGMHPKVRTWCTSDKKKIAEPSDILISVRAPVGAVNICDQKSIIGRGLSAIRVSKEIDMKFLYYFLKANDRQISALGTGSTFKAITQDTLKKIEIPLPDDINDQKRIAHLLGKVESLINQRKQNIRQLDDLVKSVFLDMFGDPVRNDKEWETDALGNIAIIERGRFSPRPRNDPKFFGGESPYIQTGDINRSNGRLREYTQTLNHHGIKVSKEFNVGTIVIAIVGATIGETALLEISTYAPDSVIGITPNGAEAHESVFLEYVLRFWKPVLRAKAPEAARANINIETLRPLKIIRPPNRVKFTDVLTKVEAIKSQYQRSLNDLESLYGALSQKAFSGELDLSKVPLPDESEEISDDKGYVDQNNMTENNKENSIFGFSQFDGASIKDNELRKTQLSKWFTEWLEHYQQESDLNINHFWQCIEFTTQDYVDENDEPLKIDVSDYDHIKDEVFASIKSGVIKQTTDMIETVVDGKTQLEPGNQILLKKQH